MTYPGGPDDGRNQDPYGGGQYGEQTGGAYGEGQYGAPMPGAPMPGGPMSDPMGMPRSVSPSEAIASGWRLFTGNVGPWLVMVLLTVVIGGAYSAINNQLEPGSAIQLLSTLLYYIVMMAVQAFSLRGALLEVDGYRPSIGDFFKLTNFGQFILAVILVAVLSTLGLIALLIGAVVVQFFLYWTTTFTLDRDMKATDALGASFRTIKSDGGNLLGLAVLNVLILILGALLVGLGLFVAIPVTTLASVWAYRYLTGPSGFSQREAEKAAAAGGTHA